MNWLKAWAVVNQYGKPYEFGEYQKKQYAIFKTKPKGACKRSDEFLVRVEIRIVKKKGRGE